MHCETQVEYHQNNHKQISNHEENIRQLTEKGMKLADTLTEEVTEKVMETEKYKGKYQNVLKKIEALLNTEK